MAYTDIYNLGYLEASQETFEVLDLDKNRFNIIENNLKPLFSIFGNGIVVNELANSWLIIKDGISINSVVITPGSGHIQWKFHETINNYTLQLPLSPSPIYPIAYYIYATVDINSELTKIPKFIASLIKIDDVDNYIGLGAAIVSSTGTDLVLNIYNTPEYGRYEISLFSSLSSIINSHKHIGGLNNPSPIDLSLHVQGKLSGENIENLNANLVTTGVFDSNRIPKINHDDLLRIGNLSHTELEDLINVIKSTDNNISTISTIDLLQLIIALKKQAGNYNIDSTLYNIFVYYPSSGSTSFEATGVPGSISLATINRTQHYISGDVATPINSDSIIWNNDVDFDNAILRHKNETISNDIIFSNIVRKNLGSLAYLTLDKPIYYKPLLDTNLSQWKHGYSVTDKSSIQSNVNFVENINGSPENQGLRRYIYYNFTSLNSWVNQQKLAFSYSVTNIPGKIFMFLILNSGGTLKTINVNGNNEAIRISESVLIKNTNPQNVTQQYVELDISSFTTNTLNNISGVGFYYQTATGWNTENLNFKLEIPTTLQINNPIINQERISGEFAGLDKAMFIWNNNYYADSGVIIFRYDTNNTSSSFNLITNTNNNSSLLSLSSRSANGL